MSFAAGDAKLDTPATGAESTPLASSMRMLPGSLSVSRIFPSGKNARLQGAGRLSISVVTWNAADAWYGARVCCGNPGLSSAFSGGRPSIGLPSIVVGTGLILALELAGDCNPGARGVCA